METLENKHKGIRNVFLVALFPCYAFFQMAVLNSVSIHFINELNFSNIDLSALSSAYLYGDALMLIPAGMLLDRLNIKHLMLISLSLLLFSSLLFFFAHSFVLALCARFFSGTAHSFALVSAFRVSINFISEKRQGFAMSFILTIAFLGSFFAQLPFVTLLIYFGYTKAVLLQAGVGLIILAILFFMPQETTQGKKKFQFCNLLANLKIVSQNKQNWLAMLYIALMGVPFVLFGMLYGAQYLMQLKQLSASNASVIVGWIFIGIILGSPVVGWLFDKSPYPRLLMAMGAFFTFVCCVLVFYVQKNLWLIFMLMGLFSSTQVLGYPIVSNNSSKAIVGISIGFVNFLIMTTLGSVQFIAGVLTESYSLSESLAIVSLAATFISILGTFFLKPNSGDICK